MKILDLIDFGRAFVPYEFDRKKVIISFRTRNYDCCVLLRLDQMKTVLAGDR